MANIKSAKKRIKVISKRTLRNKMIKSSTKTAVKKALLAIEAGNKEAACEVVKAAISAIDRAYTKGIFHKNAAARKKASIMKLYNKMA